MITTPGDYPGVRVDKSRVMPEERGLAEQRKATLVDALRPSLRTVRRAVTLAEGRFYAPRPHDGLLARPLRGFRLWLPAKTGVFFNGCEAR